MPDEVESDLLERFVHGDQAAFETLFRRFQSEVHRWIARIVRDAGTADDVLVEAFWRAYRARGRFDPSRSFGAWMRRIATNAALDAVRHARAARWRAIDDTLPAAGGPDPDVRDAIVAAFRRLPPVPGDGPVRDLWSAVVDRARPPRVWSWLDLAVAAAVVAAGVMFPGWLVSLAYYL